MKKPNNIFKITGLFLFLILSAYLFEGACFRLIDRYATWRLSLAWGEPNRPQENNLLRKMPLDHFYECPTNQSKPSHLGYWLEKEYNYSNKIFSFSRPLQDNYKDFIINEVNPLNGLKISDYGEINGLILPNLKKYATKGDVSNNLARRVGDPIETAKAIFIKVIEQNDTDLKENESKILESNFAYLAKKGFACTVLPVFSPEDLVDKVSRFKNAEPELAKYLFAWGVGKAATFLMKSCELQNGLWNGLILTEPVEYTPTSSEVKNLPWVFFDVGDEIKFEEQKLSIIYNWIKSKRSSKNIYENRLSGLVKNVKSDSSFIGMPSIFASYIIYAQKFMTEIKLKDTELTDSSSFEKNELNMNSITFDYQDMKSEMVKILGSDEMDKPNIKPKYDCEIVREYREMNSKNSDLDKISNRDIILKLGLKFEELDKNVLDQVRLKDPLFYRYYKSLRVLEDSPLN